MSGVVIKHKRGLASDWSDQDPVLAEGELGVEEDTRKFKIGDGINAWNILPYFSPGDFLAELDVHVNDAAPHPVYDDGPSLALLYENAKV